MSEIADKKQQLREQALKHRARINLNDEDISAATDLFFDHIAPKPADIIAAYYPKDREFDPLGILERWIERGGTACLPVIEKGSRILSFHNWTPSTDMTIGAYDIAEPANQSAPLTPNIIIAPMLAFDRAGRRLGYGGGYYDATLANLRGQGDVTAIGIAYSSQAVLFSLPHEEHDQTLDWILTPQGATKT